ncbi:unnamed protein product, partial [Amoebophrya sp. A25]|eukprot:GSA25T00025211001.1
MLSGAVIQQIEHYTNDEDFKSISGERSSTLGNGNYHADNKKRKNNAHVLSLWSCSAECIARQLDKDNDKRPAYSILQTPVSYKRRAKTKKVDAHVVVDDSHDAVAVDD